MAKALIAAVLLAVVLVAAVVVPFVVMPGVFGFDEWPTATPRAPHEEVVSLAVQAPRSARVERNPRRSTPRAVAGHQQLAKASPPAPAPAPTAVHGTQAQPQAAPEAPLPPPAVDARADAAPTPDAVSGAVQTDDSADGTNQP